MCGAVTHNYNIVSLFISQVSLLYIERTEFISSIFGSYDGRESDRAIGCIWLS